MSTEITSCRICSHRDFTTIYDLGNQVLGSRFPKQGESDPISVPLVLIKCNNKDCELLQLKHNTSEQELYLHSYGYRSGLNNTMVEHLTNLTTEIDNKVGLKKDDIVIDIGSNDCTLLKSYKSDCIKVGIDPTGTQFKGYYPENVLLIEDFFDEKLFTCTFGTRKAKVVTSISMFYDLPDPVKFASDIKSILAEDGIWITEQSYAVTMVDRNSFDTICHEHLEYYTLKQIKYIADQVGLKIQDISLNDCNGGSFRVTLTHADSLIECSSFVNELYSTEAQMDLTAFVSRCENMKEELVSLLKKKVAEGKKIYLYGASTKGNTLLQYYNLDSTLITAAAERNVEKYGCRTPGTNIPIISEAEMRRQQPDILLVLPWHFKKEFLVREQEYLNNGGCIIFPMPVLEIHQKKL